MFSQWLKLILAAKKKDPEDGGFLHILFFIAVAVIYAANGIIKMRRNKESEKAAEALGERVKKQPRYKSLGQAAASRQALRGQTQKSLPYAKRTSRQRIPPS